jgi:hypothetical protein
MILSIPSKAPPAINKIFCVFTSTNFWSGCLRPPLAAFTTVPSNSFNNAFAPSPEHHELWRIVALACNFINFVDKYDAAFCFGHIISAACNKRVKILSTSSLHNLLLLRLSHQQ